MAGALFDYVTESIADLQKNTPAEDLAEGRESDRIVEFLLSKIEGFGGEGVQVALDILRSADPSVFEGMVKDALLGQMLKRIPSMAKRVEQIVPVASKGPPSGATEVFLTEATRCYIFGFWHASVALSRAALEEGFWGAMKGKLPSKPEKLRDLLKSSVWSGVLDSPSASLADEVVRTGNRVLHGNPASQEKAWAVLCAVRGVLSHLYDRT
jgi:hypothetical protein